MRRVKILDDGSPLMVWATVHDENATHVFVHVDGEGDDARHWFPRDRVVEPEDGETGQGIVFPVGSTP